MPVDYLTIITMPFSKKIITAYPDYKIYSSNIKEISLDEINRQYEKSIQKTDIKHQNIEKVKEEKIKVETIENNNLNNKEVIKEVEFIEEQKVDTKAYLMNKLEMTEEIEFETYRQQMRMLINFLVDPTEQTVLLLSLGYVRNKFFSLKEIADFLGIEIDIVDNIINQGLININNIATISMNGTLSARQILERKKQEQTK